MRAVETTLIDPAKNPSFDADSVWDPGTVPDLVAVRRSDPIYNAHGYLTKIPVTAIVPFIEAFTSVGDVVCDLFAGSGMTGVAASMTGRRSELRDIAELGRHIGTGYLNVVDPGELDAAAARVTAEAAARFPGAYGYRCSRCEGDASLSRTLWSVVYACGACEQPVNFYAALETAGWKKATLECPSCSEPFATRRASRLGERAVLDTISCTCSPKLFDQEAGLPLGPIDTTAVNPPSVEIEPDRQMYRASALGKNGLSSTADFFSPRNLSVLTALRDAVDAEQDPALRQKLMFAFTAILPRASKRYQWSRKRPLNASNANYYIAPVFYEWNVFDLYLRKVRAVAKADQQIRGSWKERGIDTPPRTRYAIGSAAKLDLEAESIDYVFTDPPFGSNLFYSDMNLFQEAWLGAITDHKDEAVVDRSATAANRDATRYERLLTDALREAHRVLKPTGWVSLNFSNTKGSVWALVQRAIVNANFVLDPDKISVLDKGQRSVKGLASGFENVVTADLILSMRKARPGDKVAVSVPPTEAMRTAVGEALDAGAETPTHVYLQVVRSYLRHLWDPSELHIAEIGRELTARDLDVEAGSGHLISTNG